MSDYLAWRKRPLAPQFLHFLRSNRLDSEDDDEDLSQCLTPTTQTSQSVSLPGTTVTSTSHSSSIATPSSIVSKEG